VRRLADKGYSVERIASLGPTDPARMAYAIPAAKEFVGQEDGFAVRAPTAPSKQDVAIPGSATKGHAYIFAQGTTAAITVSVYEGAERREPRAARSEARASQRDALKNVGLAITKTDTVMVQGTSAPRAKIGVATGTGPVRKGESVTLIHGKRLYLLVAAQVADGDATMLDESFNKFVGTFRFL